MASIITLPELYAFNNIDRKLLSKLLMEFLMEPSQCILAMALWQWLEENGYPNLTVKIFRSPALCIFSVFEEAMKCLKFLENSPPFPPSHSGGILPVTSRLIECEISLKFIQENKYNVVGGIKGILKDLFPRIFIDILEHVLGNPIQIALNQPLLIPGFPHRVFGDFVVVPRPLSLGLPSGDLWGWDPAHEADECDRTVFLTFSRGFPVSRDEVLELFFTTFGARSVRDVIMQAPANPGEQCLFARLVLDSVGTVDRVLNGRKVAKFHVNGKHIWARKYERCN